MKKSIALSGASDEALLELGKVLGQSTAFGIVAGRCSAAQAGALRQARGEKVHARFGLTWNQFCPAHLKMSGTQADEIIRLLQEFGPDYFENTQSVRISAGTYRLVAPFIKEQTLHFRDEVMELNSANVQKVAKAVRESRRALPPPAGPAPAPAPEAPAAVPILADRLDAATRRAAGVIAELREVARDARETEPSLEFQSMFLGTLVHLCSELKRVGLEDAA
jgi:hypothetical protein